VQLVTSHIQMRRDLLGNKMIPKDPHHLPWFYAGWIIDRAYVKPIP